MNIYSYLNSGKIEAYVLGVATNEERKELEELLPRYVELQVALSVIEQQFEQYALQQAVPPPAHARDRFDDFIEKMPVPRTGGKGPIPPNGNGNDHTHYIPVESSTTHIRVHKNWRIFLLVLSILFKLLLVALAILAFKYFEMKSEVQELKHKVDQQQAGSR